MNTAIIRFLLTFVGMAVSASYAQQWELGGASGYGIYRDLTISRGNDRAKAGFARGPVFSAVAAHHPWTYLSGELRYTYKDSDPKVGSVRNGFEFSGETHIVHYDAMIHATPKGSRIRPFIAFGGGLKVYRGTGQEVEFQPMDTLAVVTRTDEIKPLLSLGGGVRLRLSNHALLRFDFRDYITPFPTDVVLPAPGARLSGWLHDLTPMVGISASF